jgi:hypothetical protein
MLCSIDHFIATVFFWKYHKAWFRRTNIHVKYGYHTGEKRTLKSYKDCCIQTTIIVDMTKLSNINWSKEISEGKEIWRIRPDSSGLWD